MMEVIAIHGLGYNPLKLLQRDLLNVFRERVEVKVPISAYLQVGINSVVDFENN